MNILPFLLLIVTIMVVIFILGPIVIFRMFPYMSSSRYMVMVAAAIAFIILEMYPTHAITQIVVRTVVFVIIGPMILSTAFPSVNRFVLTLSYFVVLWFAMWLYSEMNVDKYENLSDVENA